MSEDYLLDYLSEELRRDPENWHLKRMRQHRLRFLKSLGDRPRPPARQLDKARQRLLANRFLDTPEGQRPSLKFEIDRHVKHLIDRDIIIESVERDVFWTARSAVIHGCEWGDHYARIKLGREPYTKASAKMALEDAEALVQVIDDFTYDHSSFLTTSQTAVGSGSSGDLLQALQELHRARAAASRISDFVRPIAPDPGGRPGDPWKVGFVYGISHGWVSLQPKLTITPSGPFVDFVAAGAQSLDDGLARHSNEWTSAIRRAVATFGLREDGRGWLSQPGDHPQPHETPQASS